MALEGEQLGFLEKVIKLETKYGVVRIIKAIFLIGLFVFVMYNAQNFDEYVTRVVDNAVVEQAERVQEQHDASVRYRVSIRGEMQSLLEGLLQDTQCDRVFVLEMHNGTNNRSGLSFLSASMTYEVMRDGVTSIDDDYSNVFLSRFFFSTYLKDNHIWLGSMNDLAAVDNKLAMRMSSNDATYLAIVQIYGVKSAIGYLGLTYCSSAPLPEKTIEKLLTVASQRVARMLDINDSENPMNVDSESGDV